MRAMCVVMLLCLNSAYAADREEMVDYFIELENIETRADEMIDQLRDDLIGSDKKITHRNFNETFGDIFEDYRDAYIAANAEAYAVYSDEQIKELYDFYQSDFGKWYRQEEEAFEPRLTALLKDAGKTLREGVSNNHPSNRKRRK